MKVKFPTLIFPGLTNQSQALNHYMTSLEVMPTLCSQDSEPLSLEWVKNCGPTTTSQALRHILSIMSGESSGLPSGFSCSSEPCSH